MLRYGGRCPPCRWGQWGSGAACPGLYFRVAEASVSMASAKGQGQCLGSPRVSIPGIGKHAAVSATLQVGNFFSNKMKNFLSTNQRIKRSSQILGLLCLHIHSAVESCICPACVSSWKQGCPVQTPGWANRVVLMV